MLPRGVDRNPILRRLLLESGHDHVHLINVGILATALDIVHRVPRKRAKNLGEKHDHHVGVRAIRLAQSHDLVHHVDVRAIQLTQSHDLVHHVGATAMHLIDLGLDLVHRMGIPAILEVEGRVHVHRDTRAIIDKCHR